jgi:mono/diheme cytochrome c family protein/uncharacterized membrane protein
MCALIVAYRSRLARLVLACLVLVVAPGIGPGAEPPAVAAQAAQGLFQKHCVKCHGKDGTGKPARGLMPEIPDFTSARWQGQRSDAQLLDGIREGKGSDMPNWKGKLTTAESRSLVAYVRTFAPTKKSSEVSPSVRFEEEFHRLQEQYEKLNKKAQKPPPEPEQAGSSQGFFEKLLPWLGKFHPPVTSFPIALLATAALAELLLMSTGLPLFDAAGRFWLWVGAATALLAAALGWCHAGVNLVDESWLLTTHRWLGTGSAGSAALVLWVSEWSRRADPPRPLARRVVLFGVAGLVLATGYFGGALVFGLDHYAWPP